MTLDESIKLYAKSNEKRRAALASGRGDVAAQNEAAEVWNAWCKDVVAELDELKSCGEKLLPCPSESTSTREGWEGMMAEWRSQHSEMMRAWIDRSTVDFSSFRFSSGESVLRSAAEIACGGNSRSSEGGGENERQISPLVARFGEEAVAYRFNGFKFPGPVRFTGACFDGPASFNEAVFMMPVSFNYATFEWVASFFGTTFKDDTFFKKSRFKMAAVFRRAKFSGLSTFYGAIFDNEAWFQRAKFKGRTSFVQSDFNGFADFSDAHFISDPRLKREIEFRAVAVRRALSLSGTKFDAIPDFTEAQFSSAPRLDNMTLGPDVEAANFWLTVFRHCDVNTAARYRELKRLAIQAHNHELENRFFRAEQRAYCSAFCSPRPWRAGCARWWLATAYDALSDFGCSATRPLLLWVASVLCFAFLYRAFLPQSCTYPDRFWLSMFLSLSNSIPGVGLSKTFDAEQIISCFNGGVLNEFAVNFGYIGIVQYVCSIILIFLFGLGLRSIFRIK
jgi:hypothetical protein